MRKTRVAVALAVVAAVATGCATAPPTTATAGTRPALTASAETVRALADGPDLPRVPTARGGQINAIVLAAARVGHDLADGVQEHLERSAGGDARIQLAHRAGGAGCRCTARRRAPATHIT